MRPPCMTACTGRAPRGRPARPARCRDEREGSRQGCWSCGAHASGLHCITTPRVCSPGGVGGQAGQQRAAAVLGHIKEGEVLAQQRAQHEHAHAQRQALPRHRKRPALLWCWAGRRGGSGGEWAGSSLASSSVQQKQLRDLASATRSIRQPRAMPVNTRPHLLPAARMAEASGSHRSETTSLMATLKPGNCR